MPDEPKKSKLPRAVLVLILLLCGLVAGWLVLKSRRAPNLPPLAALRLDLLDETNRVATLSDGGSQDPDGTLQSWRIAWGDGKEETFSSMPQKTAHTYAAEGEYTISLWCVDNLGATSSPPALTNITFDFSKRQKALELAQAEAQRQADLLKAEEARKQAEAQREAERLKAEQAKKESERLEQERQKQLAAQEAQKAKEQQELEARRKAEAELAQQKATEAATPLLAEALSEKSSPRLVIYTPDGSTLGQFQISKVRTEGIGKDGNLRVVLAPRCVNFPHTPIRTASWQIDGKDVFLQAGQIRASLSPGHHEVTALFRSQWGTQPDEIKADITVESTGECVVTPTK